MTFKPLRVMVVEDDTDLARRLADEIRDCGHRVVGPFDDMHEAIQIAGTVQAAILDLAVQTETCFWLADALRHHDVPFVFLTDGGTGGIPSRFGHHHAYPRHRHAALLLDDLHRQHQSLPADDDDSVSAAVVEMMQRSRRIMPDASSADRLVEATLLRAVAHQTSGNGAVDVGPWLLRLLDQEYLLRGRSHLH